jgi:signal transduction histidine kinase
MAATSELQRLNAELEHRIAEKSEEIKATYARVEEAKREWAQVTERQRILADLHDGVGASLVGLLRHVQSGSADRASIERRVQEVLQEMRIAIDALQPRDGDLAAVLGALRYRLDDIIRSSGVRLAWEVEELPEVGDLKPSTVFALQRIVLEAITNALKHSGAKILRLSARACNGEVEVSIEDNGRGFDPQRHGAGLGLANMRARALRIGARLRIRSHPGKGTDVKLYLPRAPAVGVVPQAA